MNDTEYKGCYITHNAFNKDSYTVQYDGKENNFDTEEEAKEFIDNITESCSSETEKEVVYDNDEETDEEPEGHFADDKDDLDFEDEIDKDDILVEDDPIDDEETDDDEEEIDDEEDDREILTEPSYSAKDLALATVELLDSDSMDYDTGVYEKTEDALDRLAGLTCMAIMPENDWNSMCGDANWSILQQFIEDNPINAEEIFNAVADIFGYTNYKDYQTYQDWVKSDEEEYMDSFALDDKDKYYEDEDEFEYFDEATNVGAIANVPAEHKKIDLFDDEDEEDEE